MSRLQGGEGKYREWHKLFYQALTKDNKSFWEEGLSTEFLLREREKEPMKFAQEYMNNPVALEHAMFRAEYFDDYKPEDLPGELLINITCDLSCSDKTYSDYTVILPVGIDKYGDIWVLPYHRERYADPDKIIEAILNMCLRYWNKPGCQFGKLGIEKTSFQRFLITHFDRERKKRGLRFPVMQLTAKGDKTQRVGQLQPLFAAGDIHIRHDMLDLKNELLDFPRAAHDDIADALAYQINFLSKRPAAIETPDYKWKITPEIQRQKYLHRLIRKKQHRTYKNFLTIGA